MSETKPRYKLATCDVWYHDGSGNKRPASGWATFSDGVKVSWNYGVADDSKLYLYVRAQYGENSFTNPAITRRINSPKRVAMIEEWLNNV